MNRIILLALGLALFLGGCLPAPRYTQPPLPVPGEWPRGAAHTGDATTAPELSREEFFADPKLLQLMAAALEHNRDLRLAALNVERARALYGIQRAELLPAVNATGAGGKQELSGDLVKPGESRTREQYSINLGLASWELDFFGRVRSLGEQAREEYLATDEARRGAQITLLAEVARVYLTLAADRENRQLAQATLENQESALDLVRKLVKAGLATDLDLLRAQTPVETARGELARFSQLLAEEENALELLSGGPVAWELLPQDLASVTPPRELSPGLSSTLLLRRPDLMAAEHRLQGAHAYIDAARTAFFPRIALTAALGSASDSLTGLFAGGTSTWNFTPQVAIPIFDPRVWAAYRVSEVNRELLLTQYERTAQTAFREVADALAGEEYIARQLAARQALVKTTAETSRLAGERYARGLDSYLGVLDAQRNHLAAQQGAIGLRLAKLANRVRLYAALGGGGEEPNKTKE